MKSINWRFYYTNSRGKYFEKYTHKTKLPERNILFREVKLL